MTIYVRESSTWREIQQPYVRTAGVWREITNQSVRNAGTWRAVFPAQGELYTWGYNAASNFTPLGNNAVDASNRCTPVTTFAGGTNWKQVSSGNLFGAAIKTDGTLWTWGYNSKGQLGTNDTSNRNTPVTTFAGGTNWKQVSCGHYHTAAIKTDGTLWIWGSGNTVPSPVLGTNNLNSSNTPVTTFAGGTNWKQVSCGLDTTAAIKTDGTLWTWGYNSAGQLGININTFRCTPVTTFAGGTDWKQVSIGNVHIAAIKTDGTLWTWGRAVYGLFANSALGTNDTANRSTPVTTFAGGTNWKQVSAGGLTAAIKTDGTLWIWGNNEGGALGNNGGISNSTCTPVTTFAGGTNWKQVSVTSQFTRGSTAAIKTDGTLWTWGYNYQGILGINNFVDRSTPVTTFAGGTNWKQVACGSKSNIAAIR